MEPIDVRKIEGAVKREKFDVPLKKCELCGVGRVQDQMINIIICIGSPGHPNLPPFQCPETEHWGCSIEHALELGKQCLDYHIGVVVAHMHKEHENSIHTEDARKYLEKWQQP